MFKVPEVVGSTSDSLCKYKGRGFKSMAAVRRHVRGQHKKCIKRCDHCIQYFLGAEDLGAHKAFGNCTRDGIQKGQGQVREWEALFTALYPGIPIPRTPFYEERSSTPVSQGKISPVEEAQTSTAADAHPRGSDPHRQVALQTIDMLRSNINSYSMISTQPEQQTMINVVQALLPLIQQTSQVSVQQTQSSAMSGTVTGPVVQVQSADTLRSVGDSLESLPGTENADIDRLVVTEDWLQFGPSNGLVDNFNFQNDLLYGD